MCRLVALLSDEPVLLADILLRPRMSLVRQSYAAQERQRLPDGVLPSMAYQQPCLNADGFGVGWYAPQVIDGNSKPCVLITAKPAWNDANLRNIAEEVRSPLVLAHVRAAGPSLPVSDSTCHPFKAGRFLFAHNGMVGDWQRVQRKLIEGLNEYAFGIAIRHGCIDSVVAFGIFLTELGIEDEAGAMEEQTADQMCNALCRTLACLVAASAAVGLEESLLNFLVCDGHRIVGCRFATAPADNDANEPPTGATLYLNVGSRWAASTSDPTSFRMKKGADIKCSTAILSSEPLTPIKEEWLSIAPNSVVICGRGRGQSAAIDTLMFAIRPGLPAPLGALLGLETAHSIEKDIPEVQSSASSCSTAPALVADSWMTLTSHSEDVNCVASLFNGSVIVAGSMDGSLRFYDVSSGNVRADRKHSETSGPVLALLVVYSDLSPSNASSPPDSPRQTSPEISPRDAQDGPVHRSTCSSNDLLMQNCYESSPRERAIVPGYCPKTLLLSTSNNELRLWDIDACALQHVPGTDDEIPCLLCMRFAPNQGQLLAVSGTFDNLVLGFQNTRIFRLQLRKLWKRVSQAKTKNALRHFTFQIDSGPKSCLVGGQLKICPQSLLEPVHDIGCGHIGFVQCLAYDEKSGLLASGGGDGRLLLWQGQKQHASFAHGGAVLALALDSYAGELFSGDARGRIRIWDLEVVERGSRAVLVGPPGSRSAVLSLVVARRAGLGFADRVNLLAGDSAGLLRVWDTRHSIVLRQVSTSMTCCATICVVGEPTTLTEEVANCQASLVQLACGGCTGGVVRLVNLVVSEEERCTAKHKKLKSACEALQPEDQEQRLHCQELREFGHLLSILQEFVSIPTVPDDPEHATDMQRGTMWLAERFEELLGCTVRVSGNCIMARCGWDESKPLVVFYSHYSVVGTSSGWKTDPWQLTAKDGYLYGRGVSDNKGHLLAQIFAVRRLLPERARRRRASSACDFEMHIDDGSMKWTGSGATETCSYGASAQNVQPINVLFIADGCEEKGGVASVVQSVQEAREDGWLKGGASGLIITNSSWINDHSPCICYGMRGIVDLEVRVVGSTRDLHSGFHGGLVPEPLVDLMALGASLADSSGALSVPGLKNGVRPVTAEDQQNLEKAARVFQTQELREHLGLPECCSGPPWFRHQQHPSFEALRRSWVDPALSITEIETGLQHRHGRRIAREASFVVSVRTTPSLQKADVADAIQRHLNHEFAKRCSPNELQVSPLASCDWWEAKTTSAVFRAAKKGMAMAWKIDEDSVLAVREGGTLAVLTALEAELACDAVNMSLSQASDNANLPNERMSRKSLAKAVDALTNTLVLLGSELEARKLSREADSRPPRAL